MVFEGPVAQPTGTLEAIIRWIEEGEAPDKLMAERRDARGKVIGRAYYFHIRRPRSTKAPAAPMTRRIF